jgi:cytochrome c oxidase subunit IV
MAHESSTRGEHSHVRAYLRVFVALLILTILEYLYARTFASRGFLLLVMGLVCLAAIKAALVGMYFMHLVFEGRWKYLILIPTSFLVIVLVTGLMPDMARDAKLLDPARVERGEVEVASVPRGDQ